MPTSSPAFWAIRSVLVEIETAMCAYLRASELASRLRRVDVLPLLDDDSLAQQVGVDAPCVLVAMGDGSMVEDGLAELELSIVCVVRNAHSAQAARHGGGGPIGLLELAEAVMMLVNRQVIGDRLHFVTGWSQVYDDRFARRGAVVMVVRARTFATMPVSYPGHELL